MKIQKLNQKITFINLVLLILLSFSVLAVPVINIDSPENNTIYTSNSIPFNWGVTESPTSCNFSLDGGATDSSIFPIQFDVWTSNNSLVAGASRYGRSVFLYEGVWRMMTDSPTNTVWGWNWTGSTWQRDSKWDRGSMAEPPEVFYYEPTDELVLISGQQSCCGFRGTAWVWNGSSWGDWDNDFANGLAGSGCLYGTPDVFEIDGTYHLLSGKNDGDEFCGYTFNGTYWNINDTWETGLHDTGGSLSHTAIFQIDNKLLLLVGNNEGTFTGWQWDGTSWDSNGMESGIGDVGDYANLDIVYNFSGNELVTLFIGHTNPVAQKGFYTDFSYIFANITLTGLSDGYHNITLYCDAVSEFVMFGVQNCSYGCSAYSYCQPDISGGVNDCIQANETEFCIYLGNYSEFSQTQCNYCDSEDVVSRGECINDSYRVNTYSLTNNATCCAVTGNNTDCEATPTYNSSCGYAQSYGNVDVPEPFIDSAVGIGAELVGLAVFIALLLIVLWIRRVVKRN